MLTRRTDDQHRAAERDVLRTLAACKETEAALRRRESSLYAAVAAMLAVAAELVRAGEKVRLDPVLMRSLKERENAQDRARSRTG